jgi:YVTN family beta-propeller protein
MFRANRRLGLLFFSAAAIAAAYFLTADALDALPSSSVGDVSFGPICSAATAKRDGGTAIPPSWPLIESSAISPGEMPQNIYREISADYLGYKDMKSVARVYVPNVASSTVQIIDPAKLQVIGHFKVGLHPHHIVPSWDLKTLWVTSTAEGRRDGSVTPIDLETGKVGRRIPVEDPYNMYFTVDGLSAIIVAEGFRRLDFRDPQTMRLQGSIDTPQCAGINHADFSPDGRFAIFTCEYSGSLVKIDMIDRKVVGYLMLAKDSMPQDIRSSPNGAAYYVADMRAGGVHIIDGVAFKQTGFLATGVGAHGLNPSRDGRKLFVANRGTDRTRAPRRSVGSVSVIDFASSSVEKTWHIPGGGSPDMGALIADGQQLWVSGRFDDVVYAIDTNTGETKKVEVDGEPHGLTVWPQPGRYSLGHTGIMRQ